MSFVLTQSLFADGAIVRGTGTGRISGVGDGTAQKRAVTFPTTTGTTGPSGAFVYRATPLTNTANSSLGICSFWVRQLVAASDSRNPWFVQLSDTLRSDPGYAWHGLPNEQTNSGFILRSDTAGAEQGPKIRTTTGPNTAPASVLEYVGAAGSDDWFTTWSHVIAAWKTNAAVASRTYQVAVNGVLLAPTLISDTGASFTIPWTTEYPIVGNGYVSGLTGHDMHGYDMAEFYLNTDEWIDISVGSNVEKFRTAGGVPASLGGTGATPTGSTPTVYLSIPASFGAASDFLVNRGKGGNFSLSGTLALAATDPF